ncbi:hypothetical protein [Butyrivibrio sp. VCD2006]|uniref:hypothetical protein n=1 Tax=Butyrivibrio sp. VCD2006 TaxID=1280664 RepID=UPI0003F65D59|nr:hypothetical protein [Butyrivibrio sp. VCD2006]
MGKKNKATKTADVSKNKKKNVSIVISGNTKISNFLPDFIDRKAGYIYSILNGRKMAPEKCPVCQKDTEKYAFEGIVAKKIVKVKGVKCQHCLTCYFEYKTYLQYFGAFRKLEIVYPESLKEKKEELQILHSKEVNSNRKTSNVRSEMQDEMLEKIKEGEISLQIIQSISSYPSLIREPWIQEKILENAKKDASFSVYFPFVDLNQENARSFLNSLTDVAVVFRIINNNLWGVDEGAKYEFSYEVEEVLKLKKMGNEYKNSRLYSFFNSLINFPYSASDKEKLFSGYWDMVLELADFYRGKDLVNKIIISLKRHGYDIRRYAAKLEDNREINGDRINEITHILCDIPKSNYANLIKEKYQERFDIKADITKKEEREIENVNPEDIYIDDFGKEFDFSELKGFLEL